MRLGSSGSAAPYGLRLSRRALLRAGVGAAGLLAGGGFWRAAPASAAGSRGTEPRAASGGSVVLVATEPAYRGDFPDPFVLRSGTHYYAYATQAGQISVQVMQSKDLTTWTDPIDALPELPAWAEWGHTWAPTVLPRSHGYVLYYTVRHRPSGRQCISVATAAHPDGPFADVSSGPLVFQAERGGSIDSSPFVDHDGTAYLLWKSDDNALGRPTSLWAAPLRSDGMSIAGPAYQLLAQDARWEKPVIEGPALIRVGDTYYLFYGGGWWESERSAIGYATAAAPLGPYVKATTDEPWLASGPDAAGPAGPQFFTDGRGHVWIAYHAWEPGRVGYDRGGIRCLWVDRIRFDDGRPVLGRQSSSDA